MLRRSFFRSSGDGGGGNNKKQQHKRQQPQKIDVPLQQQQQQAAPPAIHEPLDPRPTAQLLIHSQSDAVAAVGAEQPLHEHQQRSEADVVVTPQSNPFAHHDPTDRPLTVETETRQHDRGQRKPTNVIHRRDMLKHHKASAVEIAVDDIWGCKTDDFRAGSVAIHKLRLAILADWETTQMKDRDHPTGRIPANGKISYDPSDTFLSLQGATLRFHSQFELMKTERLADQLSRKIGAQQLAGDESVADSTTVTTNNGQSINGVEWELTEQAAWEVWEEAIRATAALAHACVGPAWRRQLKLRRQFIRDRLPQQQFVDVMSSGSGDQKMTSSSFSPNVANLPSSRSLSLACERSADFSVCEPPVDVLELISGCIPEVLPAAMIRFSASVLETCIPPLRSENTRIYWDWSENMGIALEGNERLRSSFDQHLQEERRWLRRRKRLGDAQRDLVFGLFCGGEEDENNVVEYTSVENRWSIPGVQTPVMYMIHSWLDTCQASLIPRDIVDTNIPYHFEEINELRTSGSREGEHDESHDGPPPTEILLPMKVSQPNSTCDYTRGGTAERRKYTFWGELVDTSNFDWWYALRVLRDCSDLVSVGWRPPPSVKIGEQIILKFILIAERGIKYIGKSESYEKQIRKGRLVACSCASETLIAMKALTAREAIPQSSLRQLAISLCQLIYNADTAISSVPNSKSYQVQEGDALLEKEIFTQQSFVASNAAELLSELLEMESTVCPVADVLLEAVSIDLGVEITEVNRAEVEECAKISTVAIRALSCAMWGNHTSITGVPLLRMFWEPFIDLFGSVTSSFFHALNNETNTKFYIAGHETSVILFDEYAPALRVNKGPFLDVVFEILLAFQRLFRNEMDNLCSTEWESVVRSLDVGVSPWLLIKVDESSSRAHEIRSEVVAIFVLIISFLHSMSPASGFHPIIDDNAREYLHLFCLRKIAPLLHMEHSIAMPTSIPAMCEDDATIIALSVIKSWSVIRFLPFKEGNWARRARQLLSEAFLIPNSQSTDNCLYVGGYLHNPLVRMEALKLLLNDESMADDHTTARSVSKSEASAGSMKSRNIPPVTSLFSLTMNLRELHLVLVNSILLPRLEEVLFATTSNLKTADCQPNRNIRNTLPAECWTIENEFLLRRFAVKVLGRFYCSRTGDSESRNHFIELLQRVATASPSRMFDWIRNVEGSLSTEEFIRTCGSVLRWEELKLKLEAIRQIEECLGASFTSLPHTHANVPGILKALCNIAHFFVSKEDAELDHPIFGRLILTLASILPLSRLSCARNGQGILITREHITRNIPKDIVSLISVNNEFHHTSPTVVDEKFSIVSKEYGINSDDGDVAPFVYVKQHENSQLFANEAEQLRRRQASRPSNFSMDGKQGTIVDFEPVASEIKHVLCVASNSNSCHCDEGMKIFKGTLSTSSLLKLPSILCTISYTILSRLLSHGMAFPGADDLPWLDITGSPYAGDCEEVLARSQAVSDVAGALGYLIVTDIGEGDNNVQLIKRVCSVLVYLSKSNGRKVVQHASRGLISILSLLRHNARRKSAMNKMDEAVLSECAVSFVQYVTFLLRREATSTSQVLIPLIDALREVIVCSGWLFELPVMMRRQAFLLLFQLSHDRFEVNVVAFQAAVAIINTMSPADASLMLSFAAGPDKIAQVSKKRRIQPLLIDLLRFRLIGARVQTASANSFENKHHKSSQVHNKLAREALSMETFPVDLDNLRRQKVSAWKVGNKILTLRLGSEQYVGWLEIVVRSPCSRIRRLVRWKKQLIIERPGSTLPFWEQLHPRTRVGISENVATRNNIRSDIESEGRSKNLARTISVIASFDRLVDGTPANISSRHEVDRNFQHRNPTATSGEKRDVGKQAVTSSSGLKRILSDSSLVSLSTSHRENLCNRCNSVFSWLQQVTYRDDVDKDLIHELDMIGFSPFALGVPATEIEPTAWSVSGHEKLTPFDISSNFNRALSLLDRITPFQTHRFGLLYGGPFGNTTVDSCNNNGDAILSATQAPTDFWEFAKELGDLVPVRHCKYFSGGLDSSETSSDGLYAFVWFGCHGAGSYDLNDLVFVDSMVVFHTVTLMPNRITNRKRHVGNDVVHIVYGLSMNTLDVPNISGQFGFITIYVIPLVHVPMIKVSVHLKDGLDESVCSVLDHLVGSWLISRSVGAHFVRNLAIVADLICQSMLEDSLGLVLNTEDRDCRIRETVRHLAVSVQQG